LFRGPASFANQRILASEQRRNLTEIADRVGFQTVHTFNRAFKKVTGTTPSSFRRSCTRQATPALR
jgi:AraC-like DNA-binding protein